MARLIERSMGAYTVEKPKKKKRKHTAETFAAAILRAQKLLGEAESFAAARQQRLKSDAGHTGQTVRIHKSGSRVMVFVPMKGK